MEELPLKSSTAILMLAFRPSPHKLVELFKLLTADALLAMYSSDVVVVV